MERNIKIILHFLFVFSCVLAFPVHASENSTDIVANGLSAHVDNFALTENSYTYFGLASYYNSISYYVIDSDKISVLSGVKEATLGANEWLVVTGRFNVLAIKAEGLRVSLTDGRLTVLDSVDSAKIKVQKIKKSELAVVSLALDKLRYIHLWEPLALLTRSIEYLLVSIQKHTGIGWGWAVVIFAFLIKVLLLPVDFMSISIQKRVANIQSVLDPKLNYIKERYDGEEAHNRIMAAHKELGVTPFYTLKATIGTFIKIPILISIFNALAEMPQFNHETFLWIENLAFPDAVYQVPITIPMLGDVLSILPILMTLVTLYSTRNFSAPVSTKKGLKWQKRRLYAMALAFFVLFYPFPAVMVLYWFLVNLLQLIQQKLVKF